jgi:nicotinamidase-related amidase
MKALLVIDMQKEGVYDSYNQKTKLFRKKELILNIKKLIKLFNKKNYIVIQIKVWITNPSKTSMTKVYPNEGIANTKGTEIIDELKDEKYDYIVKKTHYSGFWNTNLNSILKKNNTKDIYITGINTGFCVFCTALDAFYRDYNVFLIEDAVSTVAGKRFHEKGIEQFKWFCGNKILKTNTLIKKL